MVEAAQELRPELASMTTTLYVSNPPKFSVKLTSPQSYYYYIVKDVNHFNTGINIIPNRPTVYIEPCRLGKSLLTLVTINAR